ncbi:valine--tRNA ligase [Candidatus Phytoplasma pruni]|uniref:Valine--tRNA ligase n=1 Tax=Candidatus Phytoplasma pruni TaxID=479893 RepID=A0A851HKF8_9MOLU|nr:valine--tRNA ligase [Candidatus Phytoplasma pruni]NWN45996.1 valine--tRNA ligase [Candidatus Phytoplasma pruni]
MEQKYNFKLVENKRYAKWLEKGYFKTQNNPNKTPFTIVIPPPNITGKLHLGHAWNNTLQDIIIRRKKMLGFDVLFLPGMDHAGIATQSKIKQKLKEEGFTEQNLTKEIFLKYAALWKDEYTQNIHTQWERLGLHLDYDYEKFTLDKDFSQVVEKVFIELYDKKLIYRDYKIINWDPFTQSTISEVEVNYQEVEGKLYYLRYYLADDNANYVEVATTRPETIFADQALTVHPDDERYQHLIGQKVVVPGTKTKIPIIADNYVEKDFGTGILKVTPAHDVNDFQIAQRHDLKIVSCMNPNGTMNELAQEYDKMDRFDCREQLIQKLTTQKLVTKIEDYTHSVGFSSISGVVIEPRLSLQWFLKTKAISQSVLQEHQINFFPKRFLKTFNHWLDNLEDWCISRQLWWGHPLPVWYKGDEIKVQSQDPGDGFQRDPDVLDTWFSSALWPLCTLGWPNNNVELFQRRFPVDALVTGYDILTFWVSKMALQSMNLIAKIPFKDVLLHGLIRDSQGQKMSKSKGNGVDPIEIIDKYGTDALRWFLTTNSSPGADLLYNETKIASSWNFINKIWNISRFIKLNITTDQTDFNAETLLMPEKFLLSQLSRLMEETNHLYDKYEFNIVGSLLYNFVWEDLANWHLEFLKIVLKEYDPEVSLNSQKFALYILKITLQLLHPFIPFVTDAIYEEMAFERPIINEQLPQINTVHSSSDDFLTFKNLIVKMRQFRQNYQINKKTLFSLYIEAPREKLSEINAIKPVLKNFLMASEIKTTPKLQEEKYEWLFFDKDTYVFMPKKDLQALKKNQADNQSPQLLKKLLSEIQRSEKILNNPSFLEKASKVKIQEEQEKYKKYLSQYEKLIKNKDQEG